MMDQAIRNFTKQFAWNPQIENQKKLSAGRKYVVVGMGGSHLAADIINSVKPELNIIIHSDYGLPCIADIKERLIIASSYSGNTEETVEAFNQALKLGLNLIAIATGGRLLALAQSNQVAYIKIPSTGIQPRSALGFSAKAMAQAMGQAELVNQLVELSLTLNPEDTKEHGQNLAKSLTGSVPVVYSSRKNQVVAYNWKIKLNESGKIPAFYNVFPELNHNEMNGFDVTDQTSQLSKNFHFIILRDQDDHPQIQKRMEILKKLYQARGLKVTALELAGKNRLEKFFLSSLLADWVSFYIAKMYNLDAEQVPMVEEFKELITLD